MMGGTRIWSERRRASSFGKDKYEAVDFGERPVGLASPEEVARREEILQTPARKYFFGKLFLETKKRDEVLLSRQPLKPCDLEVLRGIGRGTFGRVYLARVRDGGGGLFAVKVLKKKELIRARSTTQALRERTLSRNVSKSPFVVSLRCAFQSATSLYLVVDYYPGGSLADALTRKRRYSGRGYSLKDLLFYGAELLLALLWLHSKNVVHRDVKPANVLIDAEGHVALADFGVATTLAEKQAEKQADKPDKNDLRQFHERRPELKRRESAPSKKDVGETEATYVAEAFVGTVSYMAPELLRAKETQEFTAKVDLWAYGCSLYELRMGATPFAANAPRDLFANILKADFPPLAEEDSHFQHDLLKGLLDKRPTFRYDAKRAQDSKFFQEIDWTRAQTHQLTPPTRPTLPSFLTTTSPSRHHFYDENHKYLQDNIEEKNSGGAGACSSQKSKKASTKSLSGKYTPQVTLFKGFALQPDCNLLSAIAPT